MSLREPDSLELTNSNILLNPEGPERAPVGPHLERLMEARESLQGVLGKLVSSPPVVSELTIRSGYS